MNSPDSYPEHLADPTRIMLARTILEKEYRKRFLGLNEEAWGFIDNSIEGWWTDPQRFHLERTPQDFWDIFAAEMESIKLKPEFSRLITSENMIWHRANIPIVDIHMTNALEQVHSIQGLHVHNNLSFAELQQALNQCDPEVWSEQKAIVDSHSADPEQDTYPIITTKLSGSSLYAVMDGNRRTLRALLHRQETIDAWIGEQTGSELSNYWVPLNDMLAIVELYRGGTSEVRQAAVVILKAYFKSEVAIIAYRNRICPHSEAAQELFAKATRDT